MQAMCETCIFLPSTSTRDRRSLLWNI